MEMLESNYRTWCAQNDIPVEDGPPEVNDTGNMGMDLDTEVQTAEDENLALEEEQEQEQEEAGNDEEPEWQGIMDLDDTDTPSFFQDSLNEKAKTLNAKSGGGKRKRKGKVAELVREKVRRVLEDETELADKRARMCDESDFLKLLWAFNKEGIHFS